MSNIGNISRRNFFKLALGGAVVAAAASPAVAAVLKQTYADKIRHIMRLRDKLVAFKEAGDMKSAEYNATFDELIGFITDEFIAPKKGDEEFKGVAEAVRKLFDRNSGVKSDAWKDVPPTLPPAAVAISVARDVLSVQRLRMNPSAMTNFERFADKYQELILA